MRLAVYHCSIKIIGRGGIKPRSAVASAAYRSGTKMINEYDGIMHDYTRKRGVVYSEIMLPPHAPEKFSERSVLWNSVEEIEKSGNAQLAREIEVSLPRELDRESQIQLVKDYVNGCFVSAGMCADFSIHDRQDGNPHAHIMLTMRPLEQSGEWGAKCRKEYILDRDGNRIRKADGKYKSRRADTTDWNDRGKAEEWRRSWADYVNRSLAEKGIHEKVDHRSYKRQGIEKIPSVHMGAAASQMERWGISTGRGMENRRIAEQNRLLEETGRKIAGLCIYLKKLNEQKEDREHGPTLADLFDAAMNRALKDGKHSDAVDFSERSQCRHAEREAGDAAETATAQTGEKTGDADATEDKLDIVTIDNVLTDNLYNDLGIMVGGNKLLLLLEAQASWTVNILIRILLYLAQTCHEYFERTSQSLYKSKKVKMPKPELYVIYTGNKGRKPDIISLSKEFFGGADIDIEIKARVIYESDRDNIINEYIVFCKVFNEQVKVHGMTKQAVTETIRICKDRNILKQYLSSKEVEVVTIMMSLFDDEQIMRTYEKDLKRETERETAERMIKMGKLSLEEIGLCVPALSFDELKELEAEVMQLA